MSKSVVIVDAKRTPIGGFMGQLSCFTATELGAKSIKEVTKSIDLKLIDEVIFGCVLPAGLGQAPARQASLEADIPIEAGAITINKVCGSGLKSVMLANDLIQSGSAEVIVAGGMESMSNAPHLLPNTRKGIRMGHSELKDHMMLDGLENAYDGKSMGIFAQETADQYSISREEMDRFALRSLKNAADASESGQFENELTPVSYDTKKGRVYIDKDEGITTARPEKIPHLKPAFKIDGTVTAANSSSISDGSAALLLMTEDKAQTLGLQPLARVVGHASHAMKPEEFTIAPIGAISKVLEKVNWAKSDVDLFEINEAFAMVTMLATNELNLDEERVNVNGGACTLGHPIGASGARILVTLVHALKNRNLSKGIASICIGGGEAVALAVEAL